MSTRATRPKFLKKLESATKPKIMLLASQISKYLIKENYYISNKYDHPEESK